VPWPGPLVSATLVAVATTCKAIFARTMAHWSLHFLLYVSSPLSSAPSRPWPSLLGRRQRPGFGLALGGHRDDGCATLVSLVDVHGGDNVHCRLGLGANENNF
jgi:hypothetical protein